MEHVGESVAAGSDVFSNVHQAVAAHVHKVRFVTSIVRKATDNGRRKGCDLFAKAPEHPLCACTFRF
eukprot:1024664-Rhodomonas_salina.1